MGVYMARIGSCRRCGGHNASTCSCNRLMINANFPIQMGLDKKRGQARKILIKNPEKINQIIDILTN